jgi:hypothetical protein
MLSGGIWNNEGVFMPCMQNAWVDQGCILFSPVPLGRRHVGVFVLHLVREYEYVLRYFLTIYGTQ